jgi:hypothetical protein
MVVSVGLGAAVMSLLTTSTRFEERAEAQRAARMVARSAVNVVMNDVRPVDPSWGIEAASSTSITVKSPYALGMVCASTTTVQTIALLPVDSVIFAVSGYSGFAWRSAGGAYTAVSGGTITSTYTVPASCTATANIVPITAPASAPNQKTVVVTVTLASAMASPIAVGTVVVLYRRVRFYFANSAQTGLTTRTALWRNYLDAAGGAATEMVVPFASTAAFNFYISGATTSQTTVPGDLTTLRGFELFLPGESENTPRQRSVPEESDLTTAVFFINAAS